MTPRILDAVWTPLALTVVAAALAVGTWAAWRAARDQPVILRQLIAAGVVEALLVVQLLVGIGLALAGTTAPDGPTFWGYLVTTLFILPVAAAWAFAERSRWSSVVLLVAALTVAFLQYRILQVWAGA
ncbi:hypothetical protein [Actinotalea sp. K2]|uniref:hypothetical protein n=1 Tax=Actinotalea sp. K2 TaxID=2939438 RepID=UPI002017C827|nr:hypothetical protein [Actinotalea sp. K2]MCL3860719.1 hypothetical protein [Actinotalea sp. K2]